MITKNVDIMLVNYKFLNAFVLKNTENVFISCFEYFEMLTTRCTILLKATIRSDYFKMNKTRFEQN